MRVNPDSNGKTSVSNTVTITPPQTKKRVHNVFIIDASGSMAYGGRYTTAISGVNELLKSISEDHFTDNTVTVVEFEGTRVQKILFMVTDLPKHYKEMGTGGQTPLNQAIGETCEAVLEKRNSSFSKEDKVLVNIFTDGEENNSRGKYADKDVLSAYLKSLELDGFTITFQGTQSEVNYAIKTLHMNASNTSVHDNSLQSIQRSFASTISSRVNYSKSVSRGEEVTANFYTKSVQSEPEEEKENK